MKFDIALSYASEQRELAESMARTWQQTGYVVFFAPDELHNLVGKSLGIELNQIFENDSRYCVFLVSEAYARKVYTRGEFKAAMSRHTTHPDEGYLIPIRVDDTQLVGLLEDTVYIDLRETRLEEACRVVNRRIGPPAKPARKLEGFEALHIRLTPPPWQQLSTVTIEPLRRLAVVLQKDRRTGPLFNLDAVLTNTGRDPATIQAIRGRMTDPGFTSCRLSWTMRYSLGEVQHKIADAEPFDLAPGQELKTGIQFAGPDSLPDYLWPLGTYDFELVGSLADPSGESAPAAQGSYNFEVTPYSANGLRYWRNASEHDWVRLNDPHNAVGIPLEVRSS